MFASDRDEFDDPSSNPNAFELYVAENEILDREILFRICDLSSRIEEEKRNLNGSGKAAERVSVFSNDFFDPVQP